MQGVVSLESQQMCLSLRERLVTQKSSCLSIHRSITFDFLVGSSGVELLPCAPTQGIKSEFFHDSEIEEMLVRP